MKIQLICTFVKKHQIEQTLDTIAESFELLNNKVFLFKSVELDGEMIFSYNIILNSHKTFLSDSILVHRKKETNTIYTINALNELIMNLNNGVLDKKFSIEWERYRDTMLLKKTDGLKMLKIQVVKVYSI